MLTVSVVTTSFNQARFLERTILSVLEQNYPSLEYIVLDPGSTDGSRAIIERYRDRITKIIFDRDSGPADALNCGLAQATGDFCAYINSDDALLPGAVSKAVKAFERHPEVDIIYAHGYMVDGDDRILRRVRSTPFDLRRYLYAACRCSNSPLFSSGALSSLSMDLIPKREWDGTASCWSGSLVPGESFTSLMIPGRSFGSTQAR